MAKSGYEDAFDWSNFKTYVKSESLVIKIKIGKSGLMISGGGIKVFLLK